MREKPEKSQTTKEREKLSYITMLLEEEAKTNLLRSNFGNGHMALELNFYLFFHSLSTLAENHKFT